MTQSERVRHETRIEGVIDADEVIVGRGAVVEAGVLITGKHGRARKVVLGDYCFIGAGTKVLCPEFRLGHYSKWHAGGFGHGEQPLQIGRNCWIGGGVVLDSMGGLDIDDNVGIGSGSQLWTHIQFGDVVEGCRFQSTTYMHVGKDAWLVGHCLVSPVRVGERAMALLGSVVTRDMAPNHIYGGAPAVDLTAKLGTQFEARTDGAKRNRLWGLIAQFERDHPEFDGKLVVWAQPIQDGSFDYLPDDVTLFNTTTRSYRRTYSDAEVAFLKQYTPLVKFTADGEPTFIERQQDDIETLRAAFGEAR